MRRLLALGLLLVLATPPAAEGQRVRLQVSFSDPATTSGGRTPVVTTPGILRDPRWLESLQNSFPLRMEFRVEIWRVRTDWFDALERAFEFEVVVQYEPLTDEYAVTQAWGGAARAYNRFPTLQELERKLEAPYRVGISPTGVGEYYFTATLRMRTLTDDEMEDLERFLAGNPTPTDRERSSVLSRAARRLLLQFGGLPTEQLEARSSRFRVGN